MAPLGYIYWRLAIVAMGHAGLIENFAKASAERRILRLTALETTKLQSGDSDAALQ
jgi:hypothetical protein